MKKKELQKIYKEKIDLLKKYNKSYYNKNNPNVSDQEYDELKKEILLIEKNNNLTISEHSPAINVGYKPSQNFNKFLQSPDAFT